MYFLWDFSGSPVDRTWHFHWGDPGSIPGPEIKILQAVRCTTPKIYFFFFPKIYFLNNKSLESWNYSLIYGLKNGCWEGRHWITLILYISIRVLGWPNALSISSNIFKGISFFWAVDLNSGLPIFSKPCCNQMCCHPCFVVPFTEHRKRRFSIIQNGK